MKLPVVAHSNKMERHKQELDSKVQRLEKAIETFSKPTVYVAIWDSDKASGYWLYVG